MIAFVTGTVTDLSLDSATLEVGGVGLELRCTPGTLAELRRGQRTTLPTSMVVREESLTLFGFLDDDEKSLFELLQTASGVGPRLAQAMLAVHTPDGLRQALANEDVKTLTTVPGIGQKGAQRIILELKDRVGTVSAAGASQGPAAGAAASTGWRSQVHSGLVGLGWSAKEAERAVDAVAPEAEDTDGKDVAVLLRAALRTLSRA